MSGAGKYSLAGGTFAGAPQYLPDRVAMFVIVAFRDGC
jgi:hypothetical protein